MLLAALIKMVSLAPPIVGNVSGIIPRSVHASLLRNSLSVQSVTYTICLVECSLPSLSFPDSLSIAAPRMRMLASFATCILKSTGMRLVVKSPNFLTILRLARQLWQPVSAMALTNDCPCAGFISGGARGGFCFIPIHKALLCYVIR